MDARRISRGTLYWSISYVCVFMATMIGGLIIEGKPTLFVTIICFIVGIGMLFMLDVWDVTNQKRCRGQHHRPPALRSSRKPGWKMQMLLAGIVGAIVAKVLDLWVW
jgi:hypothetical protein